jgi:nitrate reductase delta subunit
MSRSRHPDPGLPPRDLATAWQILSLLVDYPTDELVGRRALLEAAATNLPPAVREPVCRFLAVLGTVPVGELQREYVETFDLTRRCCLYLTYFAHGDTRKRGLALVQVKQAYRRAGVEFTADELPDHLSVVLEFGASHHAETAWRLLNDHRAGIEVLRMALAERGSAWHDVIVALTATLPVLRGEDEDRLAALIAQGPPSEEVGLEVLPYALDPRLNPHPREAPPSELTPHSHPAGSVGLGSSIPLGAP